VSGLAGLLAHRVVPGVYRWHGAFDVPDVRHTVAHAGWRFAAVDGWRHATKAEFLEAVGEALAFPDHYGRNLDALADCLADLTAGDSEGWVLLWDGWGPLAREDERAFGTVLAILGERAGSDEGGRFAVLLRGEGPDLSGVPTLE
jgi:RNAse (barnase) inhibitor barstar